MRDTPTTKQDELPPSAGWSTSPPTEPGQYWVWQSATGWPCEGKVLCTQVEASEEGLVAWVPRMGFPENVALDPEDWSDGDAWYGAYWKGPLAVPPAPVPVSALQVAP